MKQDADAVAEASGAQLAGLLFAIDPIGFGGVVLRGMPGPVRDEWASQVGKVLPNNMPWRKVPVSVSHERLLGGLDYSATLGAGKPVVAKGLLANCDGAVLNLVLAERLASSTVAVINAAIDSGEIVLQRDGLSRRYKSHFGVVAYDEGIEDDERIDPALADRLAFHVELAACSKSDVALEGWTVAELDAARQLASTVTVSKDVLAALAKTAMMLGIESLRADQYALRAAKAIAALRGHHDVLEEDASLAARLVLAHRARRLPAEPEQQEAPPPEQDNAEEQTEPPDDRKPDASPEKLDDIVLAATQAAIPADLLDSAGDLRPSRGITAGRGRAGPRRKRRAGGRPVGSEPAERARSGRINLLATIKAALPMQTIRRAAASDDRPIYIRKSDLQVTRYQDHNESTTLFVVDASGSQAAQRLGEVKGAIELLLADCYVRRDQVALLTFRGGDAEIVLPPTRALARAKKSLAAIPAGGGTPLFAGIDKAAELANSIRRQGRTPLVVFLTDGRANVGRDGRTGHALATKDAIQAARNFRHTHLKPLVVDTSRRPRADAKDLAEAMAGTYVPMPYANAAAINAAISKQAQA